MKLNKSFYFFVSIIFIANYFYSFAGEFIDFDDSQVRYNLSADFAYYAEYKAKRINDNIISFPLKACKSITLRHIGDIYYFFLSAIRGQVPLLGQSVEVIDPDVEAIVAVRGKSQRTGRWDQIYLGYNPNVYEKKGNKTIYRAKLLAIQTKDTKDVSNRTYKFFSGTIILTNSRIGRIIRDAHPEVEPSWRNKQFTDLVNKYFVTDKDIEFKNGLLLSRTAYW